MQPDTCISLDGLDTDELLREWRWLVPAEYRPMRMTLFGDWMFEALDGAIYLLDLLEGELRRVAGSRAELEELDTHEDKRDELYLAGLVTRCRERGLALHEDECFGWRLHPKLGGNLGVENIQPFSIRIYQCLVGQLLRQLRDVKPGVQRPALKFMLPDGREM